MEGAPFVAQSAPFKMNQNQSVVGSADCGWLYVSVMAVVVCAVIRGWTLISEITSPRSAKSNVEVPFKKQARHKVRAGDWAEKSTT
jgi:hypothetical protein